MKKIWSFYFEYGRRGGNVDGTFIATQEQIDKALGEKVYFGEICGKHSEVCCNLEMSMLTELTANQEFIEQFEEILGKGFSTGYNPLDYIDED